jgi:alpha-L-fucosidase
MKPATPKTKTSPSTHLRKVVSGGSFQRFEGLRLVLRSIAAVWLVLIFAGTARAEKSTVLAIPTPEQAAWHDLEMGMFIHFGIETWQDKDTDEEPKLEYTKMFNPTNVATDQWVKVAESMHAKYIILVAKHHGGFCLWQTDTSPYSVKNSPYKNGKGDIVAELAASCKKRGMKMGVYLSPADFRFGAVMSGGGVTAKPEDQPIYNKIYRQQLTEVLSRYGEMMEIWFDGSLVIEVGDILKRYAPKAMVFQGKYGTIRWVGNEEGFTPYPAWSTVSRAAGKSGVSEAADSDPAGDTWLPIEADARIREGWFYSSTSEKTIKSVDHLMDMYYRTVGHGAVLLLDLTPDTTGLIPEADAKRAAEFGAEITRRFGVWIARTNGPGSQLELTLGKPTVIDHVITMEDIRYGERVREYVVEGRTSDGWKPLAAGTMIGRKKIDRFQPVKVSEVRLRVTKQAAPPIIRELAAYATLVRAEAAEGSDPNARLGLPPDWTIVSRWTANQFEGDTATLKIDLTAQVDAAQQYELMVRQTDGDGELVVKTVDLFLESSKLPPEFVKRTQQSGVFNLNVTALPSNKPDWCRVELTLSSAQPTTSKGEVLLRKRPLK